MSFRKRVYPDDLDKKLERAANFFGFEYTHIEMGRFPMAWYETYGLHLKDYWFDRFEPETLFASFLKGLSLLVFFFTYLAFIGIWITAFGQIFHSVLEAVGLDRKSRRKRKLVS